MAITISLFEPYFLRYFLAGKCPPKLDTEMLRFGESGIQQKGGCKKTSGTDFEDVKTYLDHLKAGQKETANFISYDNTREVRNWIINRFQLTIPTYNSNLQITLQEFDVQQIKEVTDLENQFSTFSNYNGEAEDLFCRECDKKHKFCQ